jgi:hypothetical protein
MPNITAGAVFGSALAHMLLASEKQMSIRCHPTK